MAALSTVDLITGQEVDGPGSSSIVEEEACTTQSTVAMLHCICSVHTSSTTNSMRIVCRGACSTTKVVLDNFLRPKTAKQKGPLSRSESSKRRSIQRMMHFQLAVENRARVLRREKEESLVPSAIGYHSTGEREAGAT